MALQEVVTGRTRLCDVTINVPNGSANINISPTTLPSPATTIAVSTIDLMQSISKDTNEFNNAHAYSSVHGSWLAGKPLNVEGLMAGVVRPRETM